MSDLSLQLLRAYRRDPVFRREADRTIAAVEEDERASRQEAAMHLASNLNPFGAWPDPPVDDLRDVVEASARESHADVVLHALHVSGGAAALASIPGATPPTTDPADHWVAWRGSASDFVRDMRAAIPRAKLDEVLSLLCDPPPRVVTYGNEKRRVGSDAEPALHPAANVAAFVLKAPALDRLLLVMSNKKGRAWELPGGAIEPGETPATAAYREVVEEAGIYFRAEGSGWTVDGCEVFRGTSHASLTVPGGDVTSARWFTAEEARALKLSDLPTAALIREWYMGRR